MTIKKHIPKSLKHTARTLFCKLFNIPYNKYGVPHEIIKWIPLNTTINVVDIGASEGNFFSRLEQGYNIQSAILIEPLPKRIAELQEKFKGKDNYEILNCALSNCIAKSLFYVSEEFDYVSSLFEMEKNEVVSMNLKQPEQITVNTKTLDSITDKPDLSVIDLIKIDVQGAEHLVLNSGIKTLKKTKVVYIEVSYKELYVNSSTLFDIYKIFYENNFRLASVVDGFTSEKGELLQSDAIFVNNAYFN